MPITTDAIFRLGLYESKAIVEIQTVSPGTYIIPMSTDGNSILSTLFVNSCPLGASVKVNYYDFGPGDGTLPGERYDLESHQLVSTSAFSDRIVVNKMHNKPRAEIIVAGGNVSFGVYITVVSNFAVDLKGNFLDGQPVNLGLDGGVLLSTYNQATGEADLLRSENGVLAVNPGVPSTLGKITAVSITNSSWTLITTEPLRKAVAIINESGQEIKVNYTQPSGYDGIPIIDGGERRYEHRIPLYLKSIDSACTVLVEEIV
jgi:hypothetical protein